MAVEIRVPAMGESIVDAVIARWLKKEGEKVQKDEILVELETDKVNVDVSASENGVLQQISKQEGETVGVGEVLGLISAGQASNGSTPPPTPAPDQVAKAAPTPAPAAPSAEVEERSPTPVARKIAAENQVDLAQVKVTQGRVRKEDVLNYLEHKPAEPAAVVTAPPARRCGKPCSGNCSSDNSNDDSYQRTARRTGAVVTPPPDHCPTASGGPTHRRHAYHL